MDAPVAQLVHWAQTKPDAAAFLGGGVRVDYATLLRMVEHRAAHLYSLGVRPGDTVAVALPDVGARYPSQAALFYAIAYVGASVLPLYPEVPLERRGVLADLLGARWLVSEPLPEASRAQCMDPAAYDPQAVVPAAPRGDTPQRPFLYEFTSGTTGTPKVVCATGEEYAAMRMAAAQVYGWRSDDVMMPPVPWPTKTGIRALVRALLLGATFVNLPFPGSRQELAGLVAELGLSYLDCSPWQVRRLLASAPTADGGPVPLRLMAAIGAYMAPHDIQAARQTLVANFHLGYGTTEIGLMGHLGPDRPANAALRMVPGMEGQTVDETGQPLPAGKPGRLRFRAPWIPKAYANAGGTALEGFHDGWFVSSDFGAIDEQRLITLGGRADDAINVGGLKVHPQQVEAALTAHPDVADAAVVGVPDPMAGQIAVAFLVLRRPIPLEAMLAFLAPRLEHTQIPAVIAGLDAIPRNPEGKVLRQVLRTLYAGRKG